MDQPQPVRKKLGRHSLLFLLLLCLLGILYCLNLTDSSSRWTEQLWATYFNSSTARSNVTDRHSALTPLLPRFNVTDRHSALTPLLPRFTGKQTTTSNSEASTTAAPPTTQLGEQFTQKTQQSESKTTTTTPPPPPPEYKSPGPYLVEYPYKYNFIINQADTCRRDKPFLVLVVPVAPQNKADRQIIRDTWGGQRVVSGHNIALFFLLGLGKADPIELQEESKQHGDILQSDFIDCYKNLTIKTMVMLEWLDAHCRDATYAMKIDSDVFLNLPKLVEMLQGQPTADYLTGLVERAAQVHRWPSKWFVPREIFGEERFPPYVLGLGYVLSLDLAAKLVGAARQVKALYIEDVYLGMCLRSVGLQPSDPPLHGAFHVFPPRYSRCQFSRIVATTLSEHSDRQQLWRDFSRPGPYC